MKLKQNKNTDKEMISLLTRNGCRLTLFAALCLGCKTWSHAELQPATMTYFKASEIAARCDASIAQAKSQLEQLAQAPAKKTKSAAVVLAKWDQTFAQLQDVVGPISFYSHVDPDPNLRKAAEDCELKISQFHTQVYQDVTLYELVKQTKASDPIDVQYRQDLLDAFEDKGIQLSIEKQIRLQQIIDELNKIEQDYLRNIRENPEKVEFTPSELRGLPASYIESLHKNTKGNYLLGFDYPEYRPFMQLAESDDARKRYQIAYTRRGTAKNLDLLKQAIDLRFELAQLFGQPSFADWLLRHRMAKNPQTVNRFLQDVHDKVAPLEQKEVQDLREFQAQRLKIPTEQARIERWNEAYWSEKLRQDKFQIDQEEMRQYFPTQAAQDWLFSITQNLYGIEFKRVTTRVWQEEVEYYQVIDQETGELLGGLYLDKFPREGKYGHAAVWGVIDGSSLTGRKPVSVLVTNFNRKGLNTDELETFVHEFGHVLHGLLSKTRYAAQSGTAVERDFVEAPSQMYEEWARRKETLSSLADFCSPACPRVDDALIAKLNAVHNYGRGLFYARQTLYAQFDMALHSGEALHMDPLAVWKTLEGVTALGYVPSSEFPGQFGHIMGGYKAGYYGYMWSQVIALDMLSAFGEHLNNPEVGARYRQTILSQGGQKSAAQLVVDFLGRMANSKAFFEEISGDKNY